MVLRITLWIMGLIFGLILRGKTYLPFSMAIMNSNLKVVWTNAVFWEMLGKENSKQEKLTWDYLLKSTNISQNDVETLSINVKALSISALKIFSFGPIVS